MYLVSDLQFQTYSHTRGSEQAQITISRRAFVVVVFVSPRHCRLSFASAEQLSSPLSKLGRKKSTEVFVPCSTAKGRHSAVQSSTACCVHCVDCKRNINNHVPGFPFCKSQNSTKPTAPQRLFIFREREIGVTHPLVRDSRPDIIAWPAPPPQPLAILRGNVRYLKS